MKLNVECIVDFNHLTILMEKITSLGCTNDVTWRIFNLGKDLISQPSNSSNFKLDYYLILVNKGNIMVAEKKYSLPNSFDITFTESEIFTVNYLYLDYKDKQKFKSILEDLVETDGNDDAVKMLEKITLLEKISSFSKDSTKELIKSISNFNS